MDVVSWNGHNINDTTNYVSFLHHHAYGLPRVHARSVDRLGRWPVISGLQRPGKVMYLEIIIRNLSSLAAKQVELQQWFDPEDDTPKKLVVEDLGGGTGGGNDRYVYAICEELQAAPNDENNYTFVATLRIHGDVRWRETTTTTDSWAITASGQTDTVTNNGKDVAYPIISITPTSAKADSYLYKRYIPVRWKSNSMVFNYPIDIVNNGLDTAALVTAGKMQADGDDLRVYVNGNEAERWLQDINTTTTQVWVALTFVQSPEVTLATAIASSGTISTIDANESIAAFPNSGTLIIGSEAFAFTGKNNALKQFTGVTRAAHGTSEAAHTVGDDVWMNENEVWLYYGNATATAPTQWDVYKPIFSLASTNTSWVYANFGTGSWGLSNKADVWNVEFDPIVSHYTANQKTFADPWEELGLQTNVTVASSQAKWYIQNPCGITAANFTNGEKYTPNISSYWSSYIVSADVVGNWLLEVAIAIPTVASTWQAWSQNETLNSGATAVGLQMAIGYEYAAIEFADCTLTLDSTYTPVIEIGAEQGNYQLDCILANTTTGESIRITFNMALDETLRINTDTKTITYLLDNSNQLQALTLVGGARRDWFKLAVGANTWSFTDVGTAGVTIATSWEERHYQ